MSSRFQDGNPTELIFFIIVITIIVIIIIKYQVCVFDTPRGQRNQSLEQTRVYCRVKQGELGMGGWVLVLKIP